MNGFDHFILTRFNLNVAYAPSETRLDPAWLHHRFELFDSFCYPSVHGQSTQNFKWLVFFDCDTPLIFKEKVTGYSRWENFVPVYISAATEEYDRNMRDEIRTRLSDRAQFVVTTRLDNDDALDIRFVETLQKIVTDKRDDDPEFINFTSGYMWSRSTSKLYRNKSQSNMFMSFVERADNFKTIYSVDHRQAAAVAPVREVMIAPLWLEVVHERNSAVNWVDGVRTPVTSLRSFAINAPIPSQNDWLSCWIERSKRIVKLLLPRAIITLLRPTQ